jgi:hypothetical protein
MEGPIHTVGDLTKHVGEVEHVWRATLDALGECGVGVHRSRMRGGEVLVAGSLGEG